MRRKKRADAAVDAAARITTARSIAAYVLGHDAAPTDLRVSARRDQHLAEARAALRHYGSNLDDPAMIASGLVTLAACMNMANDSTDPKDYASASYAVLVALARALAETETGEVVR